MPELPDVEASRRYLAEHAAGQRIERVDAPDPDLLRNTTPQGMGRALSGRRFTEPERHGKWLLAGTDGEPVAVLHFGMTGFLTWVGHDDARDPHDHVVFVCGEGELRVNIQRKFGGVWLAKDDAEVEDITGPLGPDAAGLDREGLATVLDGRRGGTKSALMDQELIAGVGNIVADEVLWHARLHPRHAVPELDDSDLDRLAAALDEVLARSIEAGRVPRGVDWLTHARDVDDPTCPRCGTAIEQGTVNSRPTYWCPSCQPEG
jgi:formamidopyrimidine-DNA glycosylase